MSAPPSAMDCAVTEGWPMDRILFLAAGTVTLLGVLLTVTLNHWFLLVPALVGANQLLMAASLPRARSGVDGANPRMRRFSR